MTTAQMDEMNDLRVVKRRPPQASTATSPSSAASPRS